VNGIQQNISKIEIIKDNRHRQQKTMIDIDKMMIQQKISHPSTTQNIDDKNKISNLIQLIKLNKNNIMTQIEQSKKSA
jgi:hypothetical protein